MKGRRVESSTNDKGYTRGARMTTSVIKMSLQGARGNPPLSHSEPLQEV